MSRVGVDDEGGKNERRGQKSVAWESLRRYRVINLPGAVVILAACIDCVTWKRHNRGIETKRTASNELVPRSTALPRDVTDVTERGFLDKCGRPIRRGKLRTSRRRRKHYRPLFAQFSSVKHYAPPTPVDYRFHRV